jgi:hypothetical protein
MYGIWSASCALQSRSSHSPRVVCGCAGDDGDPLSQGRHRIQLAGRHSEESSACRHRRGPRAPAAAGSICSARRGTPGRRRTPARVPPRRVHPPHRGARRTPARRRAACAEHPRIADLRRLAPKGGEVRAAPASQAEADQRVAPRIGRMRSAIGVSQDLHLVRRPEDDLFSIQSPPALLHAAECADATFNQHDHSATCAQLPLCDGDWVDPRPGGARQP